MDNFMDALYDACHDTYLYNQTFIIDKTFYEEVIKDDRIYRIGNFRPDFLHITIDQKTQKRTIRVIDAKSSKKKTQETHKF